MNIYEIDTNVEELSEKIAKCENDEQREALMKELHDMELAKEDKFDGYIYKIKSLLALADARKAEAARMKSLADATKKKADNLEAFLLEFMQKRGIHEVATSKHQIKVVKKGGKPKVELLCPDEEVPEGFAVTKVVFQPDKAAILEALQGGDESVSKWAKMIEPGFRVKY